MQLYKEKQIGTIPIDFVRQKRPWNHLVKLTTFSKKHQDEHTKESVLKCVAGLQETSIVISVSMT